MYKIIIEQTFNSIFKERYSLIKSLSIYLIILIFLQFINLDNVIIVDGKKQIQNYYIFFLNLIVLLIISMMIAISTHRILILGNKSISKWGNFKFTSREISYLFQCIKLSILISIYTFIPLIVILKLFENKTVHLLALSLVFLVSTIIFSRMSLVFPSVAIDKKMDLNDSWKLTKKYRLLMYLLVIIFPTFFSLIIGLAYGMLIKFLVDVFHPIFNILNPILNVFIVVFVASILSSAFRYILKEENIIDDEKKIVSSLIETLELKSNGIYKLLFTDNDEKSFQDISTEIIKEYSRYGFSEIVENTDKELILINPNYEKSYVYLSYDNDRNLVFEIFNFPNYEEETDETHNSESFPIYTSKIGFYFSMIIPLILVVIGIGFFNKFELIEMFLSFVFFLSAIILIRYFLKKRKTPKLILTNEYIQDFAKNTKSKIYYKDIKSVSIEKESELFTGSQMFVLVLCVKNKYNYDTEFISNDKIRIVLNDGIDFNVEKLQFILEKKTNNLEVDIIELAKMQ